MATAFVGIAAAATAAPLNPAYRAEEFEFYLSDLSPRALVVERGSESPAREVAARLGIPVVELQPEPERGAGAFALSSPSASPPSTSIGRICRRLGHRAGSAYVGHDLASEAGPADPAQHRGLRAEHPRDAQAHAPRIAG